MWVDVCLVGLGVSCKRSIGGEVQRKNKVAVCEV